MIGSSIRERQVGDHWLRLSEELNVDPVLARILTARGVESGSDLDYGFDNLIPLDLLMGIEEAAHRIVCAIEQQERIVIAGDFDADGATASVLCVSALKDFGAKNVDFAVPNRFELGYGLSTAFVDTLLPIEPDLIITVDNGISSVDGVSFAQDKGIDVIITDHHLPPKELPPATAIVNPQLAGCDFGSQPAGVGVAFYLMLQVRRNLHQIGHFEKNGLTAPNLASYLDLVALGTVVDLVPLDRNNRLLVTQGLKRMQNGQTRPGIEALCMLSGVNLQRISEIELGFQIGPRLNAAGRLKDISVGIHALLAKDIETAMPYATELHQFNQQRRELQQDMTETAFDAVEDYIDSKRCGVCIFEESYHEGVVGLVAGKLAQKIRRPTIVFAAGQGTNSVMLKGSARSIGGIHIRDVLADISTGYPDLIRSYGGHAMAAGLTIHRESFERFANVFDTFVAERAPENAFNDVVYTDGELEDHHFSLNFVHEIDALGPWGQSFPKPLFHGEFQVLNQQFTANGKHLKLELIRAKRLFNAIFFQRNVRVPDRVRIAFRPSLNEYRGRQTLQLIVEHVEPSIEENTTN
ncbi:MAG: single-stranded-DNA-specific exonuclease RecJ [Gammaproteobacteria bacterium]|nr:single-stranded-DNA-specific exonuclease RecJ [Gammaproteobacteria bacterium]MYF37774.1 single-stranded-DNA-specific exonuclease RecJ [Gammaproteobacteria bacterium]